MTRPADDRATRLAVEALQREADATDADSLQLLKRARFKALNAERGPRSSGWLWATATAAVLALAVGIGYIDRNGNENALLAQQPLAEPELYEEMEFYLWLSEELETD